MTWAKLSDDYSDDTWTLTDAAFRLHTEALVWSNRKLLDCVIQKDDLRRFAKNPDAVQELLEAGFWQESGTCYSIRHHAQYQRSREAVVAQQEANLANGKKGGRPKKPREQKTQSVTDSKTQSVTETSNQIEIDPDAWTLKEQEKFLANTGEKTQPVSESPTESETERDRTGQAFNTSTSNLSEVQRKKDEQWGLASSLEPVANLGPGCEQHYGIPVLACDSCERRRKLVAAS